MDWGLQVGCRKNWIGANRMLKQLKQHVLSHPWHCNDQWWFLISDQFTSELISPVRNSWTTLKSILPVQLFLKRPRVKVLKSQMPDSQETNYIQSTVNETLWQHTVFTESTRTVQRCSMIACDRAFCCILQCMFTHAQYYEHVHQWVCVVLCCFFLNNVFPLPVKFEEVFI